MTPCNDQDWKDLSKKKSQCRVKMAVNIYRFIERPMATNSFTKFTSTIKVGGMMGFFSSVCKTILQIENKIYCPGDTITVKVNCDNSQCSSNIRSFKIKIFRKYKAHKR